MTRITDSIPGFQLTAVHGRIASSLYATGTRLCAALALLLGASPPIVQAQSFSKFTPTFLIYYGGGPTLGSADAAKLAKYDLLDVDRFRYSEIGSNTWAAIKAANPNSQIFLYEIAPEVYNTQDANGVQWVNSLARYNVSRGHPMGSLNGNQPALFQTDASGQRIYSKAYSNASSGQYSMR